MATMKAIVKAKPERGLALEQMPVPGYGHSDLLVKIKKVGVCGTDLHIYAWDEWAKKTIKTPMVIGHEFAGEIVAMGSEVTGYKVGERISGEGHIVCGVCRSCRAGRRHLCKHTIGIGVNRDGCFAEYLCLPASNAWHLHASVATEIAAIFDPYGNAAHCALSFDMVGEDVLITGAGPIGLMATAISRFVGARNVVISDIDDYRLALARKLGATMAVNVTTSSVRQAMEQLGMIGFDIGLEMSGNGAAFESMLESMYNGGRIALLGILPESTRIDWDQIIFKGLTIKGIYGREMFETWYKMQTMLQAGLDISPVLTHRFPFERYEEAFELMESRRCGKVILELD